jgi:hypothetical protein
VAPDLDSAKFGANLTIGEDGKNLLISTPLNPGANTSACANSVSDMRAWRCSAISLYGRVGMTVTS